MLHLSFEPWLLMSLLSALRAANSCGLPAEAVEELAGMLRANDITARLCCSSARGSVVAWRVPFLCCQESQHLRNLDAEDLDTPQPLGRDQSRVLGDAIAACARERSPRQVCFCIGVPLSAVCAQCGTAEGFASCVAQSAILPLAWRA